MIDFLLYLFVSGQRSLQLHYNLYFWHVTALHTILNGCAPLTTMGVQIFFFMEGKMLKSADFDVSGPDFR